MKKPKPQGKGSFTRMCSGCGARKNKMEMLRIAKRKEGPPFIDDSGKGEGRGVYVCKNKECVQKLVKSKRLSKLLRADVGSAIYDEIAAAVTEQTEK